MPDIIFPNKNEKEFLEIAEKLNKKELYLIYPYKKNIQNYKKIIDSLKQTTKIKLKLGLISTPNTITKAKNACDFVIVESSEQNQHVLEKQKPNLIFDLEQTGRKDRMHYRSSGMNQVLCKIAVKNKITIAFSFSTLLNSPKQKRIQILGRMMQNIRFCKKYKVNALFASFAKTPFEMRTNLEALYSVLSKNL